MEYTRRKVVSLIGDRTEEDGSDKYSLAFVCGKILVDNGYRVQTGGLGGVMEAALKGARSSENYREGDTIAVIPSFNVDSATEYADIVIPTGLDVMRNAIVVNSDAVVAIGGGAGTLSEMALAWSLYKLIIAFDNVEGWGKELAGRKIDDRVRYSGFHDSDVVFAVSTPEGMAEVLDREINVYTRRHNGINTMKNREER